MIVRKDGHWKEVLAADVDAVKKAIDAEFPDNSKSLVVILPEAASAPAPAKPAKKAK